MATRIRAFRCYIDIDHCGEDNLIGILREMLEDMDERRFTAFSDDDGFCGYCRLPSGEVVGNYGVEYEPEPVAV